MNRRKNLLLSKSYRNYSREVLKCYKFDCDCEREIFNRIFDKLGITEEIFKAEIRKNSVAMRQYNINLTMLDELGLKVKLCEKDARSLKNRKDELTRTLDINEFEIESIQNEAFSEIGERWRDKIRPRGQRIIGDHLQFSLVLSLYYEIIFAIFCKYCT